MRVYTGGTFDLFHAGHVNFLSKCAQLGPVIVSLNTDEFIKEFKGQKPVMSYVERRIVLESCRYVSEVVCNDGGEDSKIAIERVKPAIIIIGSDWLKKDYLSQMSLTVEWLEDKNISLCYVPYTGGISSTDIKKRLREYE